MNNALYVGLSRQMTLKRQMDVIANNIANSDTTGFKVESLMLREDVQQPPLKPSSGSAAPEKISFVHDAGVSIDYTQGALKQTGGTFDLGLHGDGFFQVQTANGNRLTRDGRFTLNGQGQLVDMAGDPVLSNGGQPIRIDPTKTAPTISHDGTISQDGVIAGKVGVFKVADRAQLDKTEGGVFDPTTNGQTPTVDTKTTVEQGMIENSNVDAIQQMTRMIAVSRAYEQVSNMMDQTSSTSDESIQRLGKVN
jgi:flagellar basal-body rod protein FlgF